MDSLEAWLLPYLGTVSKLEDFRKLDLKSIFTSMLPWPLPKELEELAPERLTVPSGSSIKIDYTQDPPVLAVSEAGRPAAANPGVRPARRFVFAVRSF